MKHRVACAVVGILWVVTVLFTGWVFVKGWTAPSTDGRTEILLAPSERDLILGEMRDLLKAVSGVVAGLGEFSQPSTQVAQAARAAGMHMAADVNPTLLARLPLAFKQMGMSVHRDMDGLADAAAAGETPQQILNRLAGITARCTACHDMYRFGTDKAQ
jgi:phage shock protein PspC (stress-responsive transcriptional regulator)